MKQITVLISLLFTVAITNAQVITDLTNCNDHCIWTASGASGGSVLPWNIDGALPITQGQSITNSNHGIAIGHVTISPNNVLNTFVSCSDNDLRYWDGSNWISFGFTLPCTPAVGIGGYKNDFYLNCVNGVIHFDGENAPTLISSASHYYIADVSVDELGRGWMFDRTGGSVDKIIAMDRQGNIVDQYPLSTPISYNHSYGSMLKMDTFYLGFGVSNSLYPSKLVSIVIDNNNIANVGDRVIDYSSFGLSFTDLTAKTPGIPADPTVNTFDVTQQPLSIYPNPANKYIFVEQSTNQPIELFIYNLQGILIREITSSSTQTKIEIEELPAGAYIILIKEDAKIIQQQKLIKY